MRRSEREITDKAVIEEILSQASVCRLGFAFENIPYIVPVNYGYRENKIYIHSAPKGEKIESCSIITTVANTIVAKLHDRMPVILAKDCYGLWLDSVRQWSFFPGIYEAV